MPEPSRSLFHKITSDQVSGGGLGLLRLAARLASVGYGLGAGLFHSSYDANFRRVRKLEAPVIGVGNLVAGGAGKTPLTMAIVQTLRQMGQRPAVISRGYGGTAKRAVTWVHDGERLLSNAREAGDEPVMMAVELGVPVVVGPDRYKVGRAVIERLGEVVLVADDLYQHRRLHRNLNLLALDATRPFGNGALLPRGTLREPARGLRRADAVALTRADDPAAVLAFRRWMNRVFGPVPVIACNHRITGLRDQQGGEVALDQAAGRKVVAFSGLADPASFERGLVGLGLGVAHAARFGDHHYFSEQEINDLARLADDQGAAALVCTQKDAVRLPEGIAPRVPVWHTRLELEFEEHGEELEQLLATALKIWRQGQ